MEPYPVNCFQCSPNTLHHGAVRLSDAGKRDGLAFNSGLPTSYASCMFEFRNHLCMCYIAKHAGASKLDTIFYVRTHTSRPPDSPSLPLDKKSSIPTGLVGLLVAYLPQRSGGPVRRALTPPLRQRGGPTPLAHGRQNPSASLGGAALRPQPQGGSHARRKPCRGTHRLHPSR